MPPRQRQSGLLQVEPQQAEYVCSSRICDNPPVRYCPWSGPPSWQWVVNETSCCQGGRGLLLPPTMTATDTPMRRHGSHNLASIGCRDRLLQLTLSWCAAGNVGTTITRTECCGTSNFPAHSKRPLSPSLLQLHWLAVRWRIEYKVCCIMHSVHTGRCPAYLKNTVQLAAARCHDLIYGLRQRQPIYFRGSRPSLVSVRSHTLVHPRGTHCPHTSATFLS